MAEKITDRLVKDTLPPTDGTLVRLVWDSEIAGFGLQVTKGGAATFLLSYRTKTGGFRKQCKIGRAGKWSLEGGEWKFHPGAWNAFTARKGRGDERGAEELKRLVDAGGDPQAERSASRSAPSIAELCKRYIEEHAKRRKRAGSLIEDEGLIEQWIKPKLGNRKVSELRRADIERLHRTITDYGTPIRANRALSLLSKMFALAIRWDLRTDNPVHGIERNPETSRQRYLSPDELERLLKALAEDGNKDAANVVRLLLLTGARRGEVLNARWDEFDLEAGVWTKPAATTKQKSEHRIPLSAPARKLLSDMRAEADEGEKRALRHEQQAKQKGLSTHAREAELNAAARARLVKSSAYVFVGYSGADAPLDNITRFWVDLCERAGLKDFRIHDLRHSYASFLASSGMSLPIIGALLGHTQAQTTRRYAHLLDDPLRKATDRVGRIVTGAKAGKKKGKVVRFPSGVRA